MWFVSLKWETCSCFETKTVIISGGKDFTTCCFIDSQYLAMKELMCTRSFLSPEIRDSHLDVKRADDPWAAHHETNTSFWQKQACDELLQPSPSRFHEPQAKLIVCPDFNTLSRWHDLWSRCRFISLCMWYISLPMPKEEISNLKKQMTSDWACSSDLDSKSECHEHEGLHPCCHNHCLCYHKLKW